MIVHQHIESLHGAFAEHVSSYADVLQQAV